MIPRVRDTYCGIPNPLPKVAPLLYPLRQTCVTLAVLVKETHIASSHYINDNKRDICWLFLEQIFVVHSFLGSRHSGLRNHTSTVVIMSLPLDNIVTIAGCVCDSFHHIVGGRNGHCPVSSPHQVRCFHLKFLLTLLGW
jgi:hypothetical protein